MITEIYCSECKKYNTIEIPEDVDGLHIIICGFCNHKHYRAIKKGIMTDLRFPEKVLEKSLLQTFTYYGKWREETWEKNQFLSELWAKTSV